MIPNLKLRNKNKSKTLVTSLRILTNSKGKEIVVFVESQVTVQGNTGKGL